MIVGGYSYEMSCQVCFATGRPKTNNSTSSGRRSPQGVPTVLGEAMRIRGPRTARMSGGKRLRRSAKDLLEFATEVGFTAELQLGGGGLVGIALGNELLG